MQSLTFLIHITHQPRFTTDFPLEVCTLIANELEDCGHEHCLTVSCVSDPLNLTRLNKKLAQAAKPVLWTHVKTLEVFVHQLDSELYQGDGVNTPFVRRFLVQPPHNL